MASGGGAPQRDLYAETAGELSAKANLAPKVYATEAQFRPQYNALDLQSIDQLLNGIPQGSKELEYTELVTKYRNPETGELSDKPGTATSNRRDARGNPVGVALQPVQMPVMRKRSVATQATPGYLDIADRVAGKASEIEAKGLSTQRAADIADVSKLGGISLAAMQNADPRTAALIESLTTDAQSELDAGYNLTPAQLRLAQQSVRARHQGTLGGTGPAGDLNEAIGVSEYAQNLRNQRRQFAAGVTGLRSGVYGDAFNRVLSRPAAASPTAALNTAYGISSAAGPRMFGSTINANSVNDWNANAAATNAAAKANNNAALAGAGISAGVGILAALI